MTDAQLFNLFAVLFGVGIVGWAITRKPKGGLVDSFHIITAMIRRESKSRKVQI